MLARLLPAPTHRPRAFRHLRLIRARIRLKMHYWFFVPTIRATTWMYFAAAGVVGFGTLEMLVVFFATMPSVFPLLLIGLALIAVMRNTLRRGIRLLRLGLVRRRLSRRRGARYRLPSRSIR